MSDNDWLANLKAGDEVAIERAAPATGHYLSAVMRVTKTQVLVGNGRYGKRFDRHDGHQVPRGEWGCAYICAPTQQIRDDIRRHDLIDWCRDIAWGKLPLATLEAVAKIIKNSVDSPEP